MAHAMLTDAAGDTNYWSAWPKARARAWHPALLGNARWERNRLGEEETTMHPGMFWWNARRHAACGDHAGWQAAPFGGGGTGGGGGGEEFGGGTFGVRRPLRFLAYKLDLDEPQVTELAAILHELKTERAQADVDYRRTTSALADAVAADSFDEAKAKGGASERVKSTERVQAAVSQALGRIHALLRPEQRAKLAYLLRTGALSM
jgi:Spy/CpxP family protein refolding chaperone